MDSLYVLAAAEGVQIIDWPLVAPILGMYVACALIVEAPLIVLATTLICTPNIRRVVLAHNLGHHVTRRVGVETYVVTNPLCGSQQAIKWAAQHLIPESQLWQAIRMGINSPPELAKYFDVTDELVRLRLG